MKRSTVTIFGLLVVAGILSGCMMTGQPVSSDVGETEITETSVRPQDDYYRAIN